MLGEGGGSDDEGVGVVVAWAVVEATFVASDRGPDVPTVLRRDGFRVFFFSDEGWEPPHVHVERGGGVVKYWLGPTTMAYYRGMTFLELRRSKRLVEAHQDYLLERWHDYFGP